METTKREVLKMWVQRIIDSNPDYKKHYYIVDLYRDRFIVGSQAVKPPHGQSIAIAMAVDDDEIKFTRLGSFICHMKLELDFHNPEMVQEADKYVRKYLDWGLGTIEGEKRWTKK